MYITGLLGRQSEAIAPFVNHRSKPRESGTPPDEVDVRHDEEFGVAACALFSLLRQQAC